MSDTPRTDAKRSGPEHFMGDWVDANFACQLERELNAATSEIERLRKANLQLREGAEEQKQRIKPLEKDVMELKACNEYLRQKIGQRDDRIRHLIRLGLATTRPEALDQWQEEEEQ